MAFSKPASYRQVARLRKRVLYRLFVLVGPGVRLGYS